MNNKRKSIKETHPHIAQMYSEKNKAPVERISCSLTSKFTWQCLNDESHTWLSLPTLMTSSKKTLCPHCRALEKGLLRNFPELAKYYHKDNVVPVEKIPMKSNKRVQWQCIKDSKHTWSLSVVAQLSRKSICRMCELEKENLAFMHPELVPYYSEKNEITANKVYCGSDKKALWKCKKCENSWELSVSTQIHRKEVCAHCAENKKFAKAKMLGHFDSSRISKPKPGSYLKEVCPELESFYSESNDASFYEISSTSRYVALWECEKCGNKWRRAVTNQSRRVHHCSFCEKVPTLIKKSDEIASWWDDTEDITNYNIGSQYEAQWKCPEGHAFKRKIHDFRVYQCPHCKQKENSLTVKNPVLAKQYRGSIPVDEISFGSKRSVLWECSCGKKWKARVHARVQKNSTMCPDCVEKENASAPEKELFSFVKTLLPLGTELEENDREFISPQELDIYIPNISLAIEFNGVYWHSEKFLDKNYHLNKFLQCRQKGVQLLTVWEDDWKTRRTLVERMLEQQVNLALGKKCDINETEVTINEISKAKAKEFFNKNHLSGFKSKSNYFLAVHNKKTNSIIAATAWHADSLLDTVVLNQYATTESTYVGLEAMTEKAKKDFKEKEFLHLKVCDKNDNSIARLYHMLGFKEEDTVEPDFTYLQGKRRTQLIQQPIDGTTPKELHKVYDSGSTIYNIQL